MELLKAENNALRQERDDYAATVDEFIKDYKIWQQKALTPEKRDRFFRRSCATLLFSN
jgi:hypothetical protein